MRGQLNVQYVHSDEQLVDYFAKSLPTSSFRSIRIKLMVLLKPIARGGMFSEVVSVAPDNKNWLESFSSVQWAFVLYVYKQAFL